MDRIVVRVEDDNAAEDDNAVVPVLTIFSPNPHSCWKRGLIYSQFEPLTCNTIPHATRVLCVCSSLLSGGGASDSYWANLHAFLTVYCYFHSKIKLWVKFSTEFTRKRQESKTKTKDEFTNTKDWFSEIQFKKYFGKRSSSSLKFRMFFFVWEVPPPLLFWVRTIITCTWTLKGSRGVLLGVTAVVATFLHNVSGKPQIFSTEETLFIAIYLLRGPTMILRGGKTKTKSEECPIGPPPPRRAPTQRQRQALVQELRNALCQRDPLAGRGTDGGRTVLQKHLPDKTLTDLKQDGDEVDYRRNNVWWQFDCQLYSCHLRQQTGYDETMSLWFMPWPWWFLTRPKNVKEPYFR